MKRGAKHKIFWAPLDKCRDTCDQVSILDELGEGELRQLHTRIKQQTASNLTVTAYLEEISKKVVIPDRKYEGLAELVGEDAAPEYLAIGVYAVMSNMGIINTRVADA